MSVTKIKKLIVQYEDGQTDEWEGDGWLRHRNTTVKVESWDPEKPNAKEPNTETVPVRSVEVVMKL